MTKTELRIHMLAQRRSLDAEQKHLWDRQIFQRAHKDRRFQLARRIHVYLSTPEEIETWPFIEYAWGTGKEVVVPRVAQAAERSLEHVVLTRQTELVSGPFGIREPARADSEQQIAPQEFTAEDVVLVPLLAFERNGHRLGYGKGFYDTFLQASPAVRIGLAYEFQRTGHLPVEEHDVALERVATNERWYEVG